MLGVCNKEVLPSLVSRLVQSPMTLFQARALSSLADVLGRSFARYIGKVAEALLEGMTTDNMEQNDQMRQAADKVLMNLTGDSVTPLLETLTTPLLTTDTPKRRLAATQLIASFCAQTSCSFVSNMNLLVQALLKMYGQPSAELNAVALTALTNALKTIPEEELSEHLTFMRQIVRDVAAECKDESIPGFNQKGGLEPLLPVYLNALTQGNSDERESAADGIGELVSLTEEKAVAAYVKLTGPLIRVVGDRFPGPVKAAIIRTLGLMLRKTGKFMRAFVPPLSTTFLKSTSDSSPVVRARASEALLEIVLLSRKTDSVLTELSQNVKNKPQMGIKASSLQSMCRLLINQELGSKVPAPLLASIRALATEHLESDDADVRRAAAQLQAAALQYAADADLQATYTTLLKGYSTQSESQRFTNLFTLAALIEMVPQRLGTAPLNAAVQYVVAPLKSDNIAVRQEAVSAIGLLLQVQPICDENSLLLGLVTPLLTQLKDENPHMRELVLEQLQRFGQFRPSASGQVHVGAVIGPALMSAVGGVVDSNGVVRRNAQQALFHVLNFHVSQQATAQAVEGAAKKLAEMGEADAGRSLLDYCKRQLKYLKAEPLPPRSAFDFALTQEDEEDPY